LLALRIFSLPLRWNGELAGFHLKIGPVLVLCIPGVFMMCIPWAAGVSISSTPVLGALA